MAHIPSGTTAQLELVTFQQALEAANTPSEEYDIHKWLYAPNFYSEYRYIRNPGEKSSDLCGHQPLHRTSGCSGQHSEIRGADCLGQRV